MTRLQSLQNKVEHLKDANAFNVKATAEAAITELMHVLKDQDERMQRLEKLFKNVEAL
jgi:hypothetical protein